MIQINSSDSLIIIILSKTNLKIIFNLKESKFNNIKSKKQILQIKNY